MAVAQEALSPQPTKARALNFLWLEITGKCNLSCSHCYAQSSPQGSHGAMGVRDWQRVLVDAYHLGCRSVQFIGGEPTIYPGLAELLQVTASLNMNIEIYTNLVNIKPALWDLFTALNVSIATSFYSVNPAIHAQITKSRHSYQKTVDNIKRVVDAGLPLRAGIVDMQTGQAVEDSEMYLRDLGVRSVTVDRVRSVGRGETYVQVDDPREALCGQCARGKACVTPSGDVFPCVFSRWMHQGNVLQSPLSDIVTGKMTTTRNELNAFFVERRTLRAQSDCPPLEDECPPNDEPICPPKQPGECIPDYEDPCRPSRYAPCPPDKEECPPSWEDE